MSNFDINSFTRDKSICIEASAGTGKTYTIQQIVAKLLKDKTKPLTLNEILIVTFTEKAAGELKDRIRAKLREENLPDQLALVDNAPIYTIHSFCKQTLDEFSFEANQSDGLTLIDEGMVSQFIDAWVRDELSNDCCFKKYHMLANAVPSFENTVKKYYLDSQWQEVPEIATIERKTKEDDFEILFRLSEKEIGNSQKVTAPNGCFDINYLDFITKLSEKIKGISNTSEVVFQPDSDSSLADEYYNNLLLMKNDLESVDLDDLPDTRRNRFERAIPACGTLIQAYEIAALNRNFTVSTCSWKGIPTKIEEYFLAADRTGTRQALFDYFKTLKEKVETVYGVNKAIPKLEKFLVEKYVPVLYRKWTQYKTDNKLQSFDDMIRNVREAVCKDNSKLKAALQAKYKYAIIDEFQDTNQKQWDIFKNIFMEDDEHSICVVGDPKQSIYAFQGADVEVYSKAVKEIKDNDPDLPLTLSTNYRSTDRIISFCNAFFSPGNNNDFFGSDNFSFATSNPPAQPLKKPDAQLGGETVNPVWIPEVNGERIQSENDFAMFAAQQIINCCTKDSGGKTNLQVFRKSDDDVKLSNVTFKDFAVLCRVKSEMVLMKKAFSESGIPYNHYKEDNLFGGKECREWIALFSAINAPDFSAGNRKILNECLVSSFFGVEMESLNNPSYDEPDNAFRICLVTLKKTARERKWSLLQEQIYEMTGVEERLSRLDKLNSLTKLRQIGEYAVSYLYRNNCSLDELCNHLSLLSKQVSDADEENGELVEAGTDFDAVKIMTIHASKGLEFPVVISPAGLEKQPKSPKDIELRRLFYVAYTRASSIMILPWKANNFIEFLNQAFQDSEANKTDPATNQYVHLREIDFNPASYDPAENKEAVRKILGQNNQISSAPADDGTGKDDGLKAEQETVLATLSKSVTKLPSYKLSYSTLSSGKKNENVESEGKGSQDHGSDGGEKNDNSEFDVAALQVNCTYDDKNLTQICQTYPKGNVLGEAIHQTLEETPFKRIGAMDEEAVTGDAELCTLIRKKFGGQHIKIDEDDSKHIMEQSARIIWNTMNAEIPEIVGNKATGKSFCLKELEDDDHHAEVEFNMNPEIVQNSNSMQDYFNGFMDLIFVRKIDGKDVYSVLDWKSNALSPEEYADGMVLKEHTDQAYSIQRVLYSYCLIKWLRQFYEGKDEKWLFDNVFGGVYYAYIRGCRAGTGNGIYAQTWESWDKLNDAFKNIVAKKIPGGNR